MNAFPSAPQGLPHPPSARSPVIYAVPPPADAPDAPPDASPDDLPDYPPPSYHDAIHAETEPLLVGPPPDYGAFSAYVDRDRDRDDLSEASSESDVSDQCPDWAGHTFVIVVFLCILYGFWSIIAAPPDSTDPWMATRAVE